MTEKKMLIAPSVLGADFANLERELESVSTADYIHVDIMDGIFVPNISIGIPVVKCMKKVTDVPLDVHLMIDRPERYVTRFAEAGADILTIHVESSEKTEQTLEQIKADGVIPAVSVKPTTPVETVFPYLDKVKMVLIMTVEPGFGGQKMIVSCLEKCIQLKKEIEKRGLDILIEIDGGVTKENMALVKNSCVDIAVVGSAIFNEKDRKKIIEELR